MMRPSTRFLNCAKMAWEMNLRWSSRLAMLWQITGSALRTCCGTNATGGQSSLPTR